jgi:DNA-binding transcriptional MerR regulator
MSMDGAKIDNAKPASVFLTISDLADELGLPHHILRYWETRFPQLKPLQRAGNRRYYRQEDADLARRIHHLLNVEGYTIKGVQRVLAGQHADELPMPVPATAAPVAAPPAVDGQLITAMRSVRDHLARALAEDDIAARV